MSILHRQTVGNRLLLEVDADPNGADSAPEGSLALNGASGALYVNTDGATEWKPALILTPGGVTPRVGKDVLAHDGTDWVLDPDLDRKALKKPNIDGIGFGVPPGGPSTGDRYLVLPTTHAVAAVTPGSKKFEVVGDISTDLSPTETFEVLGSTGNDGTYTVSTITWVGPNTEIVVNETVPSAVADGNILYAEDAWNGNHNSFASYTGSGWDFTLFSATLPGALYFMAVSAADLHDMFIWDGGSSVRRLSYLTLVAGMLVAPPASPSAGDLYGVLPGATGAWSGKDGATALWDGSAWVFNGSDTGHLIANSGSARIWQKNGSTWLPCSDNQTFVTVEDVTATPPGGPSAGELYAVRNGATGAWSGKDGELAYYDGTNWAFFGTASPGVVYEAGRGRLWDANISASDWYEASTGPEDYSATDARNTHTNETTYASATNPHHTVTIGAGLRGNYLLRWTAVIDAPVSQEVYARCQNTTDAATVGAECNVTANATADRYPVGSSGLVTFAGVDKTFEIQWRSNAASQTVGCAASRITVERLAD